MLAVLRHQDPQPGESRTVRFEGRDYGSQVSIFLVDADPGRGSRFMCIPILRHGS